jgi:hypothetical protein
MSLQTQLWKFGDTLKPVESGEVDLERRLEDALASNLDIIDPDLLLVGRQINAFGGFIDLLAMDEEGNLVLMELKKGKTPRDVVAQTLDYASWVVEQDAESIRQLFTDKNEGLKLEEAFEEKFGDSLPEEINRKHRLCIIAVALDSSTERIIRYLSDVQDVPINAITFQCFRDGENEYLARVWLLDPATEEERKGKTRGAEPWNGRDFYVCIGEGEHRTWEDCVRYGFVSGGCGKWYSQTLRALKPGHRVFAYIPNLGYVGVGEVVDEIVPVADFNVEIDGKALPILNAPLVASNMGEFKDDPEKSEYLVRVNWQKTQSRETAYHEKGLFAKQHTACRLRNKFTLEKLATFFNLKE